MLVFVWLIFYVTALWFEHDIRFNHSKMIPFFRLFQDAGWPVVSGSFIGEPLLGCFVPFWPSFEKANKPRNEETEGAEVESRFHWHNFYQGYIQTFRFEKQAVTGYETLHRRWVDYLYYWCVSINLFGHGRTSRNFLILGQKNQTFKIKLYL